jgi:hypothetical protein
LKIKEDYFLNKASIAKHSASNNVFFNSFDYTWAFGKESLPLSDRKFTIIKEGEGPGSVDDGKVFYQYNNDWFRCDDFINSPSSKYHILFGGCSETEGMGGNVNDCWAKMLHTELSKYYDIGGYYNIGRAGYGWHQIINNFFVYSKKYGKPTHYFVMLPNIGRRYEWDNQDNTWKYYQKYVDRDISLGYTETGNFTNKNLIDIKDQKDELMNFIIGWKIFEEYCKSENVKLITTSWDTLEHHNICLFGQNESFFRMDGLEFERFILDARPNLKLAEDDLEKRDQHKGRLWHEWWAYKFINQVDKMGAFND